MLRAINDCERVLLLSQINATVDVQAVHSLPALARSTSTFVDASVLKTLDPILKLEIPQNEPKYECYSALMISVLAYRLSPSIRCSTSRGASSTGRLILCLFMKRGRTIPCLVRGEFCRFVKFLRAACFERQFWKNIACFGF